MNNKSEEWQQTIQYNYLHIQQSDKDCTNTMQLDRLIGLVMLIIASTVFLYYTTWTLLLVHPTPPLVHTYTPSLTHIVANSPS